MSGKLRLNGAGSGYSELEAPTNAGDQTFTFPQTGGTLVTDKSVDGGQIVGYQQGTWTPTLDLSKSTSAKIVSITEVESATWTRIGNQITLYIGVIIETVSGNWATGSRVAFNGIPYLIDTINPSTATGFISGGATNQLLFNGFVSNTYTDTLYLQSIMQSNTSPLGADRTLYATVTYLTDNTTWTPATGATVS
jgi:hypothetical protein